jgi:hypothetical protein
VPDFTKYKGEVLIFIFWKKVAKKGWFMFLLPICVLVCLCYFFIGDDGEDILDV